MFQVYGIPSELGWMERSIKVIAKQLSGEIKPGHGMHNEWQGLGSVIEQRDLKIQVYLESCNTGRQASEKKWMAFFPLSTDALKTVVGTTCYSGTKS